MHIDTPLSEKSATARTNIANLLRRLQSREPQQRSYAAVTVCRRSTIKIWRSCEARSQQRQLSTPSAVFPPGRLGSTAGSPLERHLSVSSVEMFADLPVAVWTARPPPGAAHLRCSRPHCASHSTKRRFCRLSATCANLKMLLSADLALFESLRSCPCQLLPQLRSCP